MVDRIRRVKDDSEREMVVDDFVTTGYRVVEEGAKTTLMRKKYYGNWIIHLLLLLTTVWFTLGLANLAYAGLAYFVLADEILIKVEG